MGDHNQKIGKWGEDLAASFLEELGYVIIERNYLTPYGELDLIALQGNGKDTCLVFVEVKTRTSKKFGFPEQAVTRKKWIHIRSAINEFLENHFEYDYDWRIDVIAIQQLPQRNEPDLRHFENILFDDDQ
jgi:putative endonuclease